LNDQDDRRIEDIEALDATRLQLEPHPRNGPLRHGPHAIRGLALYPVPLPGLELAGYNGTTCTRDQPGPAWRISPPASPPYPHDTTAYVKSAQRLDNTRAARYNA
jgi:hypothetical protein